MQLLLGQASNARRTASNRRRSKRGCWGVNDSTHSAKDLVLAGTHVMPDKCTYISVVSTVHSNIPTTLQSDQKLSKNQTADQQDAMIVVKLPAKRSASNPLWVKASNGKSPTIVTPILTVMSLQALCALKSWKQPTIYHIPPLHRLSVNLTLQVWHRSNHIQSPTPRELSLQYLWVIVPPGTLIANPSAVN